ncbi:unnamed protein product [Camellia sinensis]
MLRRQSLRPVYIKMFVLDEADEMLSRGWVSNKETLRFFYKMNNPDFQVLQKPPQCEKCRDREVYHKLCSIEDVSVVSFRIAESLGF